MLEYLKKIIAHPEMLTTYHSGLLQAKAYRILKLRTSAFLAPFDISTIEWALLGILKDNPAGFRLLTLSEMLGVEQPFVTVLAEKLRKRKFITLTPQPDDKRVKITRITPEGKAFVIKTEKSLRSEMRPLFKNASVKDLFSYLKVLSTIVENGEADKE